MMLMFQTSENEKDSSSKNDPKKQNRNTLRPNEATTHHIRLKPKYLSSDIATKTYKKSKQNSRGKFKEQ
jgi:hypothetical protein